MLSAVLTFAVPAMASDFTCTAESDDIVFSVVTDPIGLTSAMTMSAPGGGRFSYNGHPVEDVQVSASATIAFDLGASGYPLNSTNSLQIAFGETEELVFDGHFTKVSMGIVDGYFILSGKLAANDALQLFIYVDGLEEVIPDWCNYYEGADATVTFDALGYTDPYVFFAAMVQSGLPMAPTAGMFQPLRFTVAATSAVPEPTSLLVLLAGAGLLARRRRGR